MKSGGRAGDHGREWCYRGGDSADWCRTCYTAFAARAGRGGSEFNSPTHMMVRASNHRSTADLR